MSPNQLPCTQGKHRHVSPLHPPPAGRGSGQTPQRCVTAPGRHCPQSWRPAIVSAGRCQFFHGYTLHSFHTFTQLQASVLVCHAGGVCGSHFSGRCAQRAESTTVGVAATMAGMIRRLHLRAHCAQTHPVRAPCTQCQHPGAAAGDRGRAPRWPAQHTALPQPKFPVFCAHLVLQQGDEDGCCAGGRVGMLSRQAAAHVGGGGHSHPLHARLHMGRGRAAWGSKPGPGYWVPLEANEYMYCSK